MAELATIARPYAEGLFQSAQADLNGTAAWLDALATAAGNAQLLDFAANPKVSDQQVYDVIAATVPAGLPEAGRNFVRLLIENGRLQALPEIAQQFRALKNARGGASDAVVYSAFPVEAAQLGELASVLEKRFGRRLNLAVQEDASLIGGVRVVVGDEVLDTSVRARLDQMKAALTA
jgi:F-type H+-transporting ATPase subunit delta